MRSTVCQGDRQGRRLVEVVSLYAQGHVLERMPRPRM